MSKKILPLYKTCPVCKESFSVCPPGKHSRTLAPSNQTYCSKDCAYKARYRHGATCNSLSVSTAAYLAGFLDADGSIILYRRRDAVALRISLSNCNLEILEWFVEKIGAGSVVSKPVKSPKHRKAYFVQFNSDLALSLLEQIISYLHIKHEQALLAIHFQQSLKNPELKADRSGQYTAQESMKAMNRRGPR